MTDQKYTENVEYFNYLVGLIKFDARCKREIKSRIAMVKAEFNIQEEYICSVQL